MSENPYQVSAADEKVVGIRSGMREDLKSVAVYQKGIMICILTYLVAVVCQFALPPALRLVVGASVLGVGLVGTIFVFLLAMKVYQPVAGVFLGILTLIPCVGLVVLLIVNGKATGILRENGIKVGLLGARMSDL